MDKSEKYGAIVCIYLTSKAGTCRSDPAETPTFFQQKVCFVLTLNFSVP